LHWYQKACQKMIRENKSLFYVSNEENLGLTAKQCEDLLRDTEFQNTLRGEKLRYYRELASDPGRSKQSNIGALLYLADQLMANKSFDKAANVIMSVMKAEGQLNDNTSINVFADLTAKDLATMREKVEKKANAIAN
jgi:hypothetical protein